MSVPRWQCDRCVRWAVVEADGGGQFCHEHGVDAGALRSPEEAAAWQAAHEARAEEYGRQWFRCASWRWFQRPSPAMRELMRVRALIERGGYVLSEATVEALGLRFTR